MQNKINVGIIGKKFGYNVIYKSFLKNKNLKVKSFCFKSKTAGKLKIHKSIKIYSSWKKLILDKEIQAIAIATPPKLHKKIIQFAIKNNKHIFCEKPFTTSYKDANFICKLIEKKKNLSLMVNYEFGEIDAFRFFKKKIANNLKVDKIKLNWFINIKNRSPKNWKESHSKGGGIFHNYVCHAIYYLEFLFGKILGIETNISSEKKRKILEGKLHFKNNLFVELNIKVGNIPEMNPIHQLKILTRKKNYILETQLNSLSDKFKLIAFGNHYNKSKKTLFKNKKNKDDFRINPTFNNSKKFSKWILEKKIQKPNFLDAKRIHFITSKMFISSKKKKIIYV